MPKPVGQEAPFGWPAVGVPIAGGICLHWPKGTVLAGPARLRITIAISFREARCLEVVTGELKQPLGMLYLRFAPALQAHELLLDAPAAAQAVAEGVELRQVQGTEPTWILGGGDMASVPLGLRPHLMAAGEQVDPFESFLGQMASLTCIQPFGWMEGCVLDGQLDLHERFPGRGFAEAAGLHLDHYLTPDGGLSLHDACSRPSHELGTIEQTLMFAGIARLRPDHAVLQQARRFWQQRCREGLTVDGSLVSAEGSYTVAYPLALLSRIEASRDLADWALEELRQRSRRLVVGETIWLRSYADGRRTFPNWSRGVAWHLLGLCKTLALLPDAQDLRDQVQRLAARVLAGRNQQGLWSCFLDDETSPADTAGCAGIAAALAFGAAHGLLDAAADQAARAAVDALIPHLTPDGLLGGVSQSNCGGEALQRSDYRVLFPMGMGLLAQVVAWAGEGTSPGLKPAADKGQ